MVKTISIKESVYKKLVELKGNKSFSEIIEELIRRNVNIKKFKGILKDSKVLDEISKEIEKERKRIKIRI